MESVMDRETFDIIHQRLAGEEGTIRKDWGGKLTVALLYPNSYAIGMSNLGFQTLYGLFNRSERVVCERAFWERREPVSLESARPLADFDVLALSLPYEQDYFNAVSFLKASAIPTRSCDRDRRHPLVMAGGAAVMANPEPLAAIVDCFVIGEAEAVLPDLLPVLFEGIESSREELLSCLAHVPGVYVPSVGQARVTRRAAMNLADFATTSVLLTPETVLGDLYLLEIARGCPRGCRFCLAGHHFLPVRHRPTRTLLEQAREGLKFRRRIGLVSAAISDHPEIDDLVGGLRRMGAGFSVSSIRVKPLSDALLRGLAESGTRTVTLAPEAGSERLRRLIGKGFSEDDIMLAVEKVSRHGFRRLKLYFMIGLPTETDEDMIEIVRLALAAKHLLDKGRSGARLSLNVVPFVPKAGTPFQWFPMARREVLTERQRKLRAGLSRHGIEIKSESVEWSIVQGALSRGDSRLGKVFELMPRISPAAWTAALEKVGIDPEEVHRELPLDGEGLPWAKIDSGIPPSRLRSELGSELTSYLSGKICSGGGLEGGAALSGSWDAGGSANRIECGFRQEEGIS